MKILDIFFQLCGQMITVTWRALNESHWLPADAPHAMDLFKTSDA